MKADLAVARTQLKVARHSLSRVRLSLARRLALLYEQGDSDPLAVVLGASSVADALANLESMNRIADQDRAVIVQTRKASRTATGLTRKLTRKEHDLQALTDEAAQSTLVLEITLAEGQLFGASHRIAAAQRRVDRVPAAAGAGGRVEGA